MYSKGSGGASIDSLKHTRAVLGSNTSVPTLFAFQNDNRLPIFDAVSIFSENGVCQWQAIKDSCDRIIGKDFILEAASVCSIYIYLGESADMSFVRQLVEDAIQFFPGISYVGFLVQCEARMASPRSKPLTEFELIVVNI
jgi:hypothetical protein